MTLKSFLDRMRLIIVEKALAEGDDVPKDKIWSVFDLARNQMLFIELPESIELDPE